MALGLLIGMGRVLWQPVAENPRETNFWWRVVTHVTEGTGYTSCVSGYFPFCNDSNVSAMQEPAPVMVFSLVAAPTRGSFQAARFLEIALHVCVIAAIFLVTREWANATTGLLAAFLWVIYPPEIKLIGLVGGEILAAACLTFGIFFLLRASRTQLRHHWILAGICVSLSVMSRSALLPVALLLIGGMAVANTHRSTLLARLRPSVILSGVILAFLLPWLVRNTIVLGGPVMGTTLTGYNLYRHNFILGTDNYLRYVGSDEGERAVKELIAGHPELQGTENEREMDAFYRRQALRIIGAHPLRYLNLSLYRFLPLWFDWQVAEAYGRPTNMLRYALMVFQGLLLLGAFVGINGAWSRAWPLALSPLVVTLAYMCVVGQMRYVVPIMPLVLSLSAAGYLRLANDLGARLGFRPSWREWIHARST